MRNKNLIYTGFLLAGTLIGMLAMWLFVKNGVIKADVAYIADKETFEQCMRDLGYQDVNGDGWINEEDYPDNGSFQNDSAYCDSVYGEEVQIGNPR